MPNNPSASNGSRLDLFVCQPRVARFFVAHLEPLLLTGKFGCRNRLASALCARLSGTLCAYDTAGFGKLIL
jgi:hypothetical protein